MTLNIDLIIKRIKRHPIFTALAALGGLIMFVSGVVVATAKLYEYFPALHRIEELVVKGDFILKGGAALPKDLAVTVIWLDAFGKSGIFQSPEVHLLDPTKGRLGYELRLKPPPGGFFSYFEPEKGMRAGIGLVIGFSDIDRDGTLTIGTDKVVAANTTRRLAFIQGSYEINNPLSPDEWARKLWSFRFPRGFALSEKADNQEDPFDNLTGIDREVHIDLYLSPDQMGFVDSLNRELLRK
jgi:hypothetical protein